VPNEIGVMKLDEIGEIGVRSFFAAGWDGKMS
jgi:hypothetical protein